MIDCTSPDGAVGAASVWPLGLAIPTRPWMDGIPNVLLEAMAMEIPVVSTYVAGIPELIESGHNGLPVPEKDSEALARAIEDLLLDPERRRLMARRGRGRPGAI